MEKISLSLNKLNTLTNVAKQIAQCRVCDISIVIIRDF